MCVYTSEDLKCPISQVYEFFKGLNEKRCKNYIFYLYFIII
jgi:hypothetical protein